MLENKKLMIVDCENCFCKDIVKVFNKHPEFSYKLILGRDQKIDTSRLFVPAESLRCETTGHNASDFFLVCVLADALTNKKYRYDEAYLLSNDKGFDGAVKYLRGIGYKVIRLGSKFVSNDFSWIGLSESEILNCTSSYPDKERNKIIAQYKERVKKDRMAYSIKMSKENKHRKHNINTYDDIKILNELFNKLVVDSNRLINMGFMPINNKIRNKKNIKYKQAIEGAKAIKHFGINGSKAITIYRQIENWGSITDPKRVMSVLVSHGIIKLIKNKKTGTIQVYWTKRNLDNYIIY